MKSTSTIVVFVVLACSIGQAAVQTHNADSDTPTLLQTPLSEEVCKAALAAITDQAANATPSEIDVNSNINKLCWKAKHNAASPNNPYAAVAGIDKNTNKPTLTTVAVNDKGKIAEVCTAVATAGVLEAVGNDPIKGIPLGAGAKYNCEAFAQAAAEKNMLLLVLPTAVPPSQAIKDLIKGTLVENAAGSVVEVAKSFIPKAPTKPDIIIGKPSIPSGPVDAACQAATFGLISCK